MVRHFRSIRRNNGKRLTRRMRGGTMFGFNLDKAAGLAGLAGNYLKEQASATLASEEVKKGLARAKQEINGIYNEGKEKLKDTIKDGFNEALSNQKVQEGLAQALQLKAELTATAENAILEALLILYHKYPVLYNGVAQFNAIDKDGSGSISKDEFEIAFPGQPAKFDECDTDGDKSLNLVEFITCMKPKQGGRSSSRKHKYTNKLRNSRRSRSY